MYSILNDVTLEKISFRIKQRCSVDYESFNLSLKDKEGKEREIEKCKSNLKFFLKHQRFAIVSFSLKMSLFLHRRQKNTFFL